MYAIQPTTNTIIQDNSQDTEWLRFFSPVDALREVVSHIAALPSTRTPERHTLRTYEAGLKYFLAWLTGDNDLDDIASIPIQTYTSRLMPVPDETAVRAFIAHLSATGRAATTINSRYLAPTRHFIKALTRQHTPGLRGSDRDDAEDYRRRMINALDIKGPKPAETSTRSALYRHGTRLRVDQINDLFAHIGADDNRLAARRDIALVYVGITSALRISEIGRITLSDIKPGETSPYEIQVRGKRGQGDPVAVDKQTVDLIQAWVAAWNASLPDERITGERDPRHIDEHTPIWQPLRGTKPLALGVLGYQGDGLSRHALASIIKRRSREALGIDLAPHDLRRTYAARATEADIPLPVISRQLRHQNLATTAKYIGDPPNMGAAILSNRIQFTIPTGSRQ